MTVEEIIRRKAAQYGIDPNEAIRFAQIESGLNPTPKTGNGGGLYQFSQDNWKKWGQGGSITDPEANADAFMRWHKDFLQPTTTKLVGDGAEPWQRYVVHQQGEGGAEGLFKNPDLPAVEAVAPYYVSTKDPLGLKVGKQAIVGNGGSDTGTSKDFQEFWRAKYNMQPLPASQAVATAPDWQMSVMPPIAAVGGSDDSGPAGGVPDRKSSFSFANDATKAGLGLLAAGQSAPAPVVPLMPTAPIHRGDPRAEEWWKRFSLLG